MKRIILAGIVALASFSGLSAQTDVVFFHDSPTPGSYDPSWSFYNEPSELIIMAGKFEVTTAIKKDGDNALRLEWRSEATGDWGACVARAAWATFDMNNFKELRFWVYSETAIAKENLPETAFEANGGKKTGRIKLGQYLPTGLAANTWVEVVMPIADIKAATTDAAYPFEVVKSLFFFQDATDAAVHCMYIDEISLKMEEGYVAPTVVRLFDDSADNTFHDASWLNITAPSVVAQPEGKAGKFPIVTTPVLTGANAAKLTWTSNTGGNWAALLADKNWAGKDASDMDEISIWVNSPAALAKDLLPMIDLEGVTGGRTGKVELKDFATADLIANTWTEIVVPIAAIKAANPTATAAWANIKGIFFSQSVTDAAEHTLFIDAVTYRKTGANSLIENKVPSVRVAYSNGALLINDYSGKVAVYNTVGQLIRSTETTTGAVQINLSKGAYIVKTQSGSSKIMVL